MIRKLKGPDHIADHIEKRGYRHNYVLYYTGADYYCSIFVGITPMTAYAGGPDCPIEEAQPDDPESVAAEEPEPEGDGS